MDDEIKKWVENAEKGIELDKPAYVLKSTSILKDLKAYDIAETILRKGRARFPHNLMIFRELCAVVIERSPREGLDLIAKEGNEFGNELIVQKANALGKMELKSEAIDELESAIEIEEHLRTVRMVASKLMSLYLDEGMFGKAEKFLEPLIEQGVYTDLPMKQILADTYIRNRHPSKALEILKDCYDRRSRELKESAKKLIGEESYMPLASDKPIVFVVYGHDQDALYKLELTLRRIGAEPLIFSQLPTAGSSTIIEILEENIPRADAIVVLLTADDEGRKRGSDSEFEPRARQNTLIEAGYAVISQRRKSLLVSLGSVNIPSDFDGIYRVEGSQWSDSVASNVARRLQSMGLNIDISKA